MENRPDDPKWLDDRMIQLWSADRERSTGRLEGQLYGAQMEAYIQGRGEKPRYERTPEYRLMRHYEREYVRIIRSSR